MDRVPVAAPESVTRIPYMRGDGPYEEVLPYTRVSIPYMRGGRPNWNPADERFIEYSLHAWGWTEAETGGISGRPVFPTCVGMDRTTIPTRI